MNNQFTIDPDGGNITSIFDCTIQLMRAKCILNLGEPIVIAA